RHPTAVVPARPRQGVPRLLGRRHLLPRRPARLAPGQPVRGPLRHHDAGRQRPVRRRPPRRRRPPGRLPARLPLVEPPPQRRRSRPDAGTVPGGRDPLPTSHGDTPPGPTAPPPPRVRTPPRPPDGTLGPAAAGGWRLVSAAPSPRCSPSS